jgi:phenol 2-monooxygenase
MQFHLNGFVPGDPDIHPPLAALDERPDVLPEFVDVLIAGSGPAGLCLAAQLARVAGIRTMVVEPKLVPMEKGQADGINLRSMEMFQAFGFAEKVKRESVWINETTFWNPDPAKPDAIRRVGRVQDVADGLSHMPHVLINQARVHDMFLDIMRHSPSRLEPTYGLKVVTLTVDPDAADYPVTVTLEHTAPDRAGQTETVRARYVVGCDGARSAVRQAIGAALHGDAAHQAWGVMDVLAVTDFPDYRMKSIVQSSNEGTILFLPREGGYLVRLYVELARLGEDERAGDRGMTEADIVAKAQRILRPFSFDVKHVVWWSIYEIGHRLTDAFDDVPPEQIGSRTPRVMLAGDACHTHSPKAGQGMNVSMGDTFNLGWKLIAVLTGRASPDLLYSYTTERRAAAKGLVDFDHRWSRVIGAKAEASHDDSVPRFQREFIANGEFTAGLTICYEPSTLIGADAWQPLATGLPIGMRFHSAPVIRLADAKPMQLGDVIEADGRWRIFAFADAADHGQAGGPIHTLCDYLGTSQQSPLLRHTYAGEDIDAVIDLRAIFQQGFRDLEITAMPSLLRPHKGRFGLCDYEKVFCADLKGSADIFAMRGIDRTRGCVAIIRPDQHVAQVLPLSAHDAISAFFAGFLCFASANLVPINNSEAAA